MKIKVAILGASGYTALELIKILLRHPHAEIVALTTRQEMGAKMPNVADLHPSLRGLLDMPCELLAAPRLATKGTQCVFSCLPHGVSMHTVPELLDRGMRVIDLSADYRLRDPNVYAQWYGESHSDLAHLAQAVYGLPEMYREEIAAAPLVANPGCYPQSAVLGLIPVVAGGLIDTSAIIVDSKSGVSGAGRTPKLSTHFPECNESVSAYNVGAHRHTPEIEQTLIDLSGDPVQVLFTPHLVPMNRGILSTIYAVPRRPVSVERVRDLYREYYARNPFVRVVPHPPATKDVVGTNFCDISVHIVRDRLVVLSCLDNLLRGASGVAVQNFNIMYGFPETAGLL